MDQPLLGHSSMAAAPQLVAPSSFVSGNACAAQLRPQLAAHLQWCARCSVAGLPRARRRVRGLRSGHTRSPAGPLELRKCSRGLDGSGGRLTVVARPSALDQSRSSQSWKVLQSAWSRIVDTTQVDASLFAFLSSERAKVVVMLAFALGLCNADRVIMAVAIVPMAAARNWSATFAGLVQVGCLPNVSKLPSMAHPSFANYYSKSRFQLSDGSSSRQQWSVVRLQCNQIMHAVSIQNFAVIFSVGLSFVPYPCGCSRRPHRRQTSAGLGCRYLVFGHDCYPLSCRLLFGNAPCYSHDYGAG